MTLLDRVSARLDARGIPYALIGAAALAAAGLESLPRAMRDRWASVRH